MRSVSTLLLACAFAAPVAAVPAAMASTVSGHVYLERDGRAGRGPGDPGVAAVAVSNGSDIVRTDAQGRYTIPFEPGQAVFVVKPAAHRFIAGADGLPAFWRRIPATVQASERAGVDFGLLEGALPAAPAKSMDGFQVLLFTDTQVKGARDIDYYRRDIVEPIIGRHDAALGMTLGDLVDDEIQLYPALNAVTARLGVPWFHVPGNHDVDPGATGDAASLASWKAVYGPDTYAVEEGNAAFVFLDNVVVQPGTGPGYIGGLREDQFRFIENYLAQLPPGRLLVLGMHIPVFDTGGRETFRAADRARLFALLKDHPRLLLLSGHSHHQQHYWHTARDGWQGAAPLHEYNVGAACGAFWSGAPDAAGIPDATMADGTPNGYGLLSVHDDGGYALAFHPARMPAAAPAFNQSMALHAPRVLRRGAYPAWGVFANVFMGDADTRVEYRIDGGQWKPMRRVERADPRLLVENVADDLATPLRGFDRSPEAVDSTHLWRGALATDLATGGHRVEVRAFDRWQGEATATTSYTLQDAGAD
ncbi:calcineurin-like phosphoesterase C-terminal domain-containing protein [Pseudoxanthomonas daejeonensis]|uniref:Calcineurin phosphoesterase n=1 Tax=Pseudoxanthomonas daejeonensis TaxID=266062 RepID=A0ABQ6Z9M3_9GAMM|nr:calcineurin-like phosphoesterase family protein [Pseudoxanthomonas daejeonensis]KAF1696354.1 calcineurin phosphoesterase [Pseudoxanthomonas daejeonensis]